ncbi:MAG: protein kinase [Candidatus Obscuribacter sp.]|nr:protein kinase [Candidatus Obscuribacter sp.]MBK9280029.1 protein kinase [Candidatus Obscuribacter sp.]MBL8084559.1 protein kinase [Candidatus Obscuribacter sp.]
MDGVADSSPGSVKIKKVCLTCNAEFESDIDTCPADGTVLTSLTGDSLIGTVLGGRYEILDTIGDGAMGRVYLARHKLMKRQVAVKMMHPQLISGKSALRRFQKEAELASALNHPNILTVYDFGVTETGSPYLVMDYLQGKELLHVLKDEGHLPQSRGLHIFKQVCAGLAHAHDKGVVHRDLKPSNVMLVTLDGDDSFVKILDFGIAKQLNPSESSIDNLTRTGEVFGTPHYMSPEQCRAQDVDGRSDIYALGCVMYQTFTGHLPITGCDLIECLYKHVNSMPESFHVVAPELPLSAELEAIVFKAMAKSPDERFQSMQEFRAAMEVLEPGGYTGTYSRVDLPAVKIEAASRTVPADGGTTSSGDAVESVLSITHSGEDVAENKQAQTVPTVSEVLPAPVPVKAAQSQTAVRRAVDLEWQKRIVIAVPVVAIGIVLFFYLIKFSDSASSGEAKKKIAALQEQAAKDYDSGDYAQAKKSIRSAFKLEDDSKLPRDYRSRFLLGQIQYAQGDYDDAEANMELSYNAVKTGKPGSLDLAAVAIPLGRARAALKDYEGAAPVLQEGYDIRIQKLKPGDKLIGEALTGLGDLNMRRGRLKEALNQLRDALKIAEATSGEKSLEVALAQNNLAQAYQLSGDYPMAEDLYKKALSVRRQQGSDAAPLVADSLQCLGTLYISTGKMSDALLSYKEALEIGRKFMEPSDPRYVSLQQKYGELLARSVKGK